MCIALEKEVINEIKGDLLEMCDTPEESLGEIVRYVDCFPKEPDYNIAQYGNLLVYYDHVRDFYTSRGYKDNDPNIVDDGKLWEMYKKHVGCAARKLLKERDMWPWP